MDKRRANITPETLCAVASELVGVPISQELATVHATSMREVMELVDMLRRLPIKDLPPPLAFAPEEDLL